MRQRFRTKLLSYAQESLELPKELNIDQNDMQRPQHSFSDSVGTSMTDILAPK